MPTLDWENKSDALRAAKNIPYRLLEFDSAQSCGDDENFIVQGDNLDALNSLLPFYRGRVKCIYIDPPYNTHSAFEHYDDNFEHAEWLSMMYPRLELLRDFLSDDGAIFISIDDEEAHYLKVICDEIFGRKNFLAELIWNLGTGTTAGHFTRDHETIFCYVRNKASVPNFKNFNADEKIIHGALKKISRKNPPVEITFPAGFEFEGTDAVFSGELGNSEKEIILSDEMRFKDGKLVADTKIVGGFAMRNQIESFIRGEEVFDSKGQRVNRFFFNKNGILFYEKAKSIINPKSVLSGFGSTKNGTNDLRSVLGDTTFDFPKPVELIKYLIQLVTEKNSLVLDAFAGSGTTAHAVINLNATDGGARKFILIEEKEYCKTITAERVRRVGGSFKFFRVGEKLFDETGALNPSVTARELAAFIWFKFTGRAYPSEENLPLIGIFEGAAYYLACEPLTKKFLATLPAYDGQKIIFGATSRVSADFLSANKIIFKQLPSEIKA